VVGEGNTKKVIPEDEKFDESIIPLKKFSEYEAEAWGHGSHRSDETRLTGRVLLPTAELHLDRPVLTLNRRAVSTRLLSQGTSTVIRT